MWWFCWYWGVQPTFSNLRTRIPICTELGSSIISRNPFVTALPAVSPHSPTLVDEPPGTSELHLFSENSCIGLASFKPRCPSGCWACSSNCYPSTTFLLLTPESQRRPHPISATTPSVSSTVRMYILLRTCPHLIEPRPISDAHTGQGLPLRNRASALPPGQPEPKILRINNPG